MTLFVGWRDFEQRVAERKVATVSEDTRIKWANEIEEEFRKNPSSDVVYRVSGNSMVIGMMVDGFLEINDVEIKHRKLLEPRTVRTFVPVDSL